MSKLDKFAELNNLSSFTARDAISAFGEDGEADRVGRRALTNFANIEIDRIIAKDQVRKTYDDQKHQEMVAMLRESGQLQPIVVYWSEDDQRYVVFMGHRRLRAAPEAGMTSIDCSVLSEPPNESERIEKQLVENIAREDLNPIDEAEAFQELCTQKGCNAKELAQHLGKAASTVQRAIKLLSLPEDIREKVRDGEITKSIGRELTKCDEEQAMRSMLAKIEAGESRAEIAELVKKKPGLRTTAPKGKMKKEFTVNGIKLTITGKRKTTKSDIAAALRVVMEQLESDGRSKKPAIASETAA